MADIAFLKALAQQKLKQRGMEWFWPAMDYIYSRESGWNPQAHNTKGEDSVGLGQMNRAGGMGTGYSVEQLMDPSFNMDLMLNHVQGALSSGADLQTALQPWSTTHGIDAASLVSGQIPQGGGTMTTPTQTTTGDITQKVIAWLDSVYGPPSDTSFGGGYYFSKDPQGWTDYYRKNVLGETAGAETMTPYESANIALGQQTESRLGQKQVWDMDTWTAEFERDKSQYGDKIALQKFTDKVGAAQEGRDAAQAAVEYESQFAPAGQTESPYTAAGSPYAQYMQEHGMNAGSLGQYHPTSLPRTAQEAFGQFTPPVPEYAPTPAMALPSPAPVGEGGGVPPNRGQGPSVDVLSGGYTPGPTTGPQSSLDPLGFSRVLLQALQRLGLR